MPCRGEGTPRLIELVFHEGPYKSDNLQQLRALALKLDCLDVNLNSTPAMDCLYPQTHVSKTNPQSDGMRVEPL